MYRFTGMSRAIDPRHPSNRYALAIAATAGVIALMLAPGDVANAVAVGGSALLGWALGRELDPDRNRTAAIAAPTSAAMAWLTHFEGHAVTLGGLYLLVVAARVTARTTGVAPTRIDLVLHIGVCAWIAAGPLAWVPPLALAVAVVRDTVMSDPAPPENLWWGAAMGLVAAVVAGFTQGSSEWQAPGVTMSALLVAGLVGSVIIVRSEPMTSTTDHRHLPLDPERVAMGRLTVTVGAGLTAMIGGAAGVGALAPVWMTLAVAGIVRLGTRP